MIRWFKAAVLWFIGIGGSVKVSQNLEEDRLMSETAMARPMLESMSAKELRALVAEVNQEMHVLGVQSRLHQTEIMRLNKVGPTQPMGQRQASAIATKNLAHDVKDCQDKIGRLGKRLEAVSGILRLKKESISREDDPTSKLFNKALDEVDGFRRQVLHQQAEITSQDKGLDELVAVLNQDGSDPHNYDPDVEEILDSWRMHAEVDAATMTQDLVEKFGAKADNLLPNR